MNKRKNNSEDQKSNVHWIGFLAVIIGAIITGLFGIYIARIKTDRDPASTNTNPSSAKSSPQKFNLPVIVRDRDNNAIGQATVLLTVGQETVAQVVTDDNGQANFSVDRGYYDKRGRLFAKSPDYYPGDLEVALSTDSRIIIQLIHK
jgi:hypothetical protein